MTNHLNDGTLAPQVVEWLGRYAGAEQWITDVAERAAKGIAPMPNELRRLGEVRVTGSAGGGWRTIP